MINATKIRKKSLYIKQKIALMSTIYMASVMPKYHSIKPTSKRIYIVKSALVVGAGVLLVAMVTFKAPGPLYGRPLGLISKLIWN